jgi:hypothetical protein
MNVDNLLPPRGPGAGKIAKFDPWHGPQYRKDNPTPSILVVGHSRYDSDYSDRRIIGGVLAGKTSGTFTKFTKAMLGCRHREADYDDRKADFWNSVTFHNWNTTFFPGGARTTIPKEERRHEQNTQLLLEVLRRYKPSHAVIWGLENWTDVCTGISETDGLIPGTGGHYYMQTEGFSTIFTWIVHPSAGFNYERWIPMLKAFLAMEPPPVGTPLLQAA